MREKLRERGSGVAVQEGGKIFPNGRNYSKQGNRIQDGEVTTFYFTNFPEYLTVQDLRERFAGIWRVDEVYIPQKLDRRGKRFGFVRGKQPMTNMVPGKGIGGEVRQGVSFKQSLANVDLSTLNTDKRKGGLKQPGTRRGLTATQILE
ncbi:hypothetical protein A2U01_0019155, partial [Trifolium medium]|nr:hypothetical protein [Trifolium medium]